IGRSAQGHTIGREVVFFNADGCGTGLVVILAVAHSVVVEGDVDDGVGLVDGELAGCHAVAVVGGVRLVAHQVGGGHIEGVVAVLGIGNGGDPLVLITVVHAAGLVGPVADLAGF